jgi:hypothetical protein
MDDAFHAYSPLFIRHYRRLRGTIDGQVSAVKALGVAVPGLAALWRARTAMGRQNARPAVNLPANRKTTRGASRSRRTETIMKIALFALLGLVLGAIGGAALGIGAGLAWIEIFKTSDFEGYSGMLVFFSFMPAGAIIGGLGGAASFGIMAARDDEIAVESQSPAHQERR